MDEPQVTDLLLQGNQKGTVTLSNLIARNLFWGELKKENVVIFLSFYSRHLADHERGSTI